MLNAPSINISIIHQHLYFNAQRGELQKWIPSQMITPHIRQSEKYEEGEF
jgi:hypothetical protein